MTARRIPARRTLLGVVVVALILGGAGTAAARWSASGSGAGTASNGSLVPVILTSGTPSAGIYPSSTANVIVTASNPNPDDVQIRSLALDTTQGTAGFSVDAGHAGCGLSALSLTTQTNAGAGWLVPKRIGAVNGTLPITLTNALALATDASSACQGATFTVFLAAGP